MPNKAFSQLGSAVSRRCRGGGLAFFALMLAMTRQAYAERIVIVQPDSSELGLTEVFNRLRGELRMHGFETILASENGAPSPDELRRVSELSQADAAIALEKVEGEPTCHVWFVDHESAQDRVMSIAVPETDETPTLLALRTVELLRSSLRERTVAAPPLHKDESKPLPPPRPTSKPQESGGHEQHKETTELRFRVRVGGTFIWVASQLPASFALAPSMGYRVTERLELAARFIVPWTNSRINASQVSAEVRTDLGMIELRWSMAQPHPIVDIESLLAVGVARCSGLATAPSGSSIEVHSATAWPVALGLGLGSWFVVSPRWHVGATGAIGTMVRQPRIRVAGNDTALGHPWFELGASFAYSIF